MDDKIKIGLAITGVAIVAYSIGHTRATQRMIKDFGGAASREAIVYLATQEAIRKRFK
jgi:hypothetical protein